MKKVLCEWIGDMLYSIDENLIYLINFMKLDFLAGGYGLDFNEIIQKLLEPIKAIALIIVSICFLLEFLKITIKFDVLKWEFMFKVFFKLVFAKVCIDISYDLLVAIYQTSVELIGKAFDGVGGMGTLAYGKIDDTIWNYGTMELIGVFCSVGLLFIGICIGMLIGVIMGLARMIEIVIFIAVSPLPCAFLPLEDGGTSRIPKNYFINFASLCLSGVIMTMTIVLYSKIGMQMIEEASDSTYDVAGKLFIATILFVLTMSKSGNIAKSILST